MTTNTKIFIMMQRLEGKSLSEIAESIRMSKQGVSKFMSTLPKSESADFVKCPEITEEKAEKVFEAYFRHPVGDHVFDRVAKEVRLPVSVVRDLFYFCRQTKNPLRIPDCYYPAVVKWMNRNGYTVEQLAIELSVPKDKFRDILSGHAHMRLELAEGIQKLTGITIREIYKTFVNVPNGQMPAAAVVSMS